MPQRTIENGSPARCVPGQYRLRSHKIFANRCRFSVGDHRKPRQSAQPLEAEGQRETVVCAQDTRDVDQSILRPQPPCRRTRSRESSPTARASPSRDRRGKLSVCVVSALPPVSARRAWHGNAGRKNRPIRPCAVLVQNAIATDLVLLSANDSAPSRQICSAFDPACTHVARFYFQSPCRCTS